MKQFSVVVECVVRKLVTCEGCTLEQARSDPFEFAVTETEIEQRDWTVVSATEDE